MFGLKKMVKKATKKAYKVGIKKVGKKGIKLVAKVPSASTSFAVGVVSKTVKLTTGSDKLARKAALIGHIGAGAMMGSVGIIGGVAKWKLDDVVDRI